MVKDFSNSTKTVSGYKVKDIRWNSAMGLYIGMVIDPECIFNEGKEIKDQTHYSTALWTRSGKCGNQLRRPDCDLVYEQPTINHEQVLFETELQYEYIN